MPIRLEQNLGVKGQSVFYRHVNMRVNSMASDR